MVKVVINVPFDPNNPKPWYCGPCNDGPQNVKLNKKCIACGATRDSRAYVKKVIEKKD